MNILLYLLLTVHVAVSALMVISVLMQRPRSEGLGAAFGGGMTDNLFGAQTTHVLAKFTTILGIVFFILTLALAMIYSRTGSGKTEIQRELMNLTPPAAATERATSPAAGTVVVGETLGDPTVEATDAVSSAAESAAPVSSESVVEPPADSSVSAGEAVAPVEETSSGVSGDATPQN